MRVLIVEENADLALLWSNHLRRQEVEVEHAQSKEFATAILHSHAFDVVVVNTEIGEKEAVSIADYVGFRLPNARVVFVTSSNFFSDGSIFAHSPNASACVPSSTPPEDLAALVEFHGRYAGA